MASATPSGSSWTRHALTRNMPHPCSDSRRDARSSRSAMLRNFAIHRAALGPDGSRRGWRSQPPCQKQPSTKTASRCLGSAISTVSRSPGTRRWTRKRRPARCSALRRSISGWVSWDDRPESTADLSVGIHASASRLLTRLRAAPASPVGIPAPAPSLFRRSGKLAARTGGSPSTWSPPGPALAARSVGAGLKRDPAPARRSVPASRASPASSCFVSASRAPPAPAPVFRDLLATVAPCSMRRPTGLRATRREPG